MSRSTPDDLAVAFRSLVRRRTEALAAAEDAPVSDLLADLDGHIAAAASLVGSATTPEAIAEAIASRPAKEWDVATLDALRHHATAAGIVLRRVAESGPPPDD
jgi:hypothetical protein